MACSWNLGNTSPPRDLSQWILPGHAIYAIGKPFRHNFSLVPVFILFFRCARGQLRRERRRRRSRPLEGTAFISLGVCPMLLCRYLCANIRGRGIGLTRWTHTLMLGSTLNWQKSTLRVSHAMTNQTQSPPLLHPNNPTLLPRHTSITSIS